MKCNEPTCTDCHATDIPEPVMDIPMVNIPALMQCYCRQTEVINPFDTFVTVQNIIMPDMSENAFPFFELVVKEVFDNGQITANMYALEDGKRIFSQATNFAPPHSLKQMVHQGLFVPQSFFLQFIDSRVVHEIDQSDPERSQVN